MDNLTEIAKKSLEEIKGFISANNYKVLNVEKHYCEMEAVINDSSKNPYGIAHGGFIFGLADTAAGIVAMTDERTAVTINSNIDSINTSSLYSTDISFNIFS